MTTERVTTKHVAVGDRMIFPRHWNYSGEKPVLIESRTDTVAEISNDSQCKRIIGESGIEWYGGAASKVTKVIEEASA